MKFQKLAQITGFGFLFLFILLSQQNCAPVSSAGSGSDATAFSPFSTSESYFRTASTVTTEVYYETGAEPYVGSTTAGRPFWSILSDNITAIFQYRTLRPTLTIPQTLAEMTSLGFIGKTDWTTTDILNLNQSHRAQLPSATDARFYIYFLNGNFNDSGQRQTGVIGVSISGTPVIAIFKSVVRSTGSNPNGTVPKFVEQSTLVHEMGHALGFVNNGVPMVTPHQDVAHGAHSTDTNCVMYWQNEGASDLVAFIQKYLVSSSVVMWGSQTMQDAQSFSR